MNSLQYCILLVKQIIKATLGIELSDQDAQPHAQELDSQLREEYKGEGSPYGLRESDVLRYIQERVNTELTILIE